jgi:Xaa-Pro aminopeptidase
MNNLNKLQKKCAEMELDAILLTGDINRRYATGFRSSAGMAVITPNAAKFSTDFRYIEAAKEKLTDFHVEMCTRENNYYALMAQWAKELGLKRVGFEDSIRTVKSHETWKTKLEKLETEIEWAGAQEGIASVRAVKESWEIERMIAAQRIAEKVFDEILNIIRAGMTEREIAAEMIFRMYKNGAEKPSFDPIVVGGENSSLPHGEPGDRPVQSGDFLTMDFGCVYDGYCSDMTRTIAIGYVTDEMREIYDIVSRAQTAGIDAAKADIVGERIHEAAEAVIEAAGYKDYFGHGFGHGIGMEVHEDYSAAPSEKREIKAGMVISAEPGIYLPGKFGVRIEDLIVIRENGCDNITKANKELIVI